MAGEYYPIPENPQYSAQIRALSNDDPANAGEIFNPLFERLIENTAAVRKTAEGKAAFSVVTALPEAADAEENTLYFVKNGEGLCDIYVRNSVRMTAESLFTEAYGLELAEGQTAAVKLETPGFDINVTVSAGTTVDDVTQKANATAKYYGALFTFDEESGQIAAHNTGDNSPIEVTVTAGGEALTGTAPCEEMLRLTASGPPAMSIDENGHLIATFE